MKPGQASSTARLIAAAQVLAAREPTLRHLVHPESAELSERLLRAGGRDWLLVATHTWLGRRALRGLERATLPGLVRHWLSRKQAIERLVREAMGEGWSQLLVLGAGLDTLPLRLAGERKMQRIVCIDHPATQAVVRRAFPEFGTAAGLMRLVPFDLSAQGFGAEFNRGGSLADLPTIVIAEGLLMYLTRERVAVLLRDIAGLPVPHLRVILTAMDAPEGEPIAFRPRSARADRWLHRHAEPMLSSIPAGREAVYLDSFGLWHIRTITACEMQEGRTSRLGGENILIAERADS